jgi:hypothetical protein
MLDHSVNPVNGKGRELKENIGMLDGGSVTAQER